MFSVAGKFGVSRSYACDKGRDRVLISLFAIYFIGGHLPFMSAPFVNLEAWYAHAAKFLYDGEIRNALKHLEKEVANPLGFSVGVVPFYWILGVSEFSSRLFAMFTGLLAVGILYRWASWRFSPGVALGVMVLVGLNPLFWVHSGLAYTDIPFLAVLSLSLICLEIGLREERRTFIYTSAILFGVSVLIKYNAFAFVLVVIAWVFLLKRSLGLEGRRLVRETIAEAFLYFLTVLVMIMPYAVIVYANLGHLLHPYYITATGLNPTSFQPLVIPYRVLAIVMWVGIFTGPLFPLVGLDIKRKLPLIGNRMMFLSALASPLGAMMVMYGRDKASLGEMRLGWAEFLFDQELIVVIMTLSIFAGLLTCIGFGEWALRQSSVNSLLGVWFFVGLFMHALFRPSMRYVLFILPPLAVYLSSVVTESITSQRFRKLKYMLLGVYVGLFGFLGIFNSAYLAAEGYAAATIANYINENNLRGISFKKSWDIFVHAGYLIREDLIRDSSETNKYHTATLRRSQVAENRVYETEVKVLGIVFKRYAILRSN